MQVKKKERSINCFKESRANTHNNSVLAICIYRGMAIKNS